MTTAPTVTPEPRQGAGVMTWGPISIEIRGRPVPQGTLTRSPTGGLYHGNRPELLAWRARIADQAQAAMAGLPPFTGPVEVSVTFRLARPRSHYLPANSKRPEDILRDDAPLWHNQKPDADKLLRAILDALSSIVVADDEQVARIGELEKIWADAPAGPGATISVSSLPATLREARAPALGFVREGIWAGAERVEVSR